MQRNMMKIIFAIVIIALTAFLYAERVSIREMIDTRGHKELPAPVTYHEVTEAPKPSVQTPSPNSAEPVKSPVPSEPTTASPLPEEINLAVPFTSQAPRGDWSLPFKEACEEASVFMVTEFYRGTAKGNVDADVATREIERMVAFEKELFGFYEDTTVAQTAALVEQMFGYEQSDQIENPTVEQIQRAVADGHPVIVPLAGRELGNPFYTPPGPVYHMLVIRGYTRDGSFITNDPGTKRGEAYVYPFDTLMNAIHDWNGEGNILEGKRVALVLHPSL